MIVINRVLCIAADEVSVNIKVGQILPNLSNVRRQRIAEPLGGNRVTSTADHDRQPRFILRFRFPHRFRDKFHRFPLIMRHQTKVSHTRISTAANNTYKIMWFPRDSRIYSTRRRPWAKDRPAAILGRHRLALHMIPGFPNLLVPLDKPPFNLIIIFVKS